MNNRSFSAEQIADLLKNSNVTKCSAKTISFSPAFKVRAIKQSEEGFSAVRIFKEAGFDLDIIGQNTPKGRVKDWRGVCKTKGIDALKTENRGLAKGLRKGRPKIKGVTDADRIKRLEIEVAYLKAENDFLARLRAQRKS
jgi:transposase